MSSDVSPADLGASLAPPPGVDKPDPTDDQEDDSTPEPRLRWYVTGWGHEWVTDRDPHHERVTPHYIHRLAAYAWGFIDSPADPRDVHHRVPESWLGDEPVPDGSIPWLTGEDYLEATEPDDHARHHIGRGRS